MRATFPWCQSHATPACRPDRPDRSDRTRPRRDQRGLVFPSPVVVLSVLAVAMAAVAFLATRGTEPTEREVTTASEGTPAPAQSATPAASPTPTPTKKAKPAIERSAVFVEVYNNSGIKGLAGGTAATAADIGWQVVGADNWYGTIPATTVYYPQRLKRAAQRLALDLGVKRTAPAIDPMREDRLTLILTGPIG